MSNRRFFIKSSLTGLVPAGISTTVSALTPDQLALHEPGQKPIHI